MSQSTLTSLIKKEFFSFVNSAQAYLVIIPFVLLSHFLFFRSALVMGDANLRPFIELLPWFLIVLIPALTMRSFADEYRRDTLELLFAHPISEWQLLLGKLLGAFLFYVLILASTLSLPLTLVLFSKSDLGLMFGQYLGALLLGFTYLSLGLTIAVYIKNSIGSFLVSAAINFVLVLLNMQFVVLMFPGIFGRIVNELAVMNHLTNLGRGVIDFRDLAYFITLSLVALSAGVYQLSERKLVESSAHRRRLQTIFVLGAAVAIVFNLFLSSYPLRLDLTASRQYSLSSGTKTLLKNLPDRVTLTLYASKNLPAPMQVTMRQAADWMKDFSRYSSKISLSTHLLGDDSQSQSDAVDANIREVQFNQIGSSSFQVQTGYLGLTVRYADKVEAISYLDSADNLEYQLSRLIVKLTSDTSRKVGFLNTAVGLQASLLTEFLSNQYDLVYLDEGSKDSDYQPLAAVIIVDDGSDANASASATLAQYLTNQGNVLLFANGVNANTRTLSASTSQSTLLQLFQPYGAVVNPDLVYDLQLHELIVLPSAGQQLVVQYPFWPRALVNTAALPWPSQVNNLLLSWPSSITLTPVDGVTQNIIVKTSQSGGHQEKSFSIDPTSAAIKNLPDPSSEPLNLAATLTKSTQRLGLVGNAGFLADDFMQNSPENQNFVANLIDWVSADPILASIPKRTSARNVFTFKDPSQVVIVQYANLLVPPLLVGVFGFWWLRRRRQLSMRP